MFAVSEKGVTEMFETESEMQSLEDKDERIDEKEKAVTVSCFETSTAACQVQPRCLGFT